MPTPLPVITALIRAGAVEHATTLFAAEGYDRDATNPAALAVKGRLLKTRARRSVGAAKAALQREAAAAYMAADTLSPAPYLAINAATLFTLAGNHERGLALAHTVLTRLDAPEPPADTPYFLAATRAEALLILDDLAAAEHALRQAVASDPDGWDDRATTIIQLEELALARGHGADWLSPYRPPAALHFAGHMGLRAGGIAERALHEEATRWIAAQRIGFGFGALAAGADVIIAEALLAAGAELHLVLCSPPEVFVRQSVVPAGAMWLSRYHAVLEAATSVTAAGPASTGPHDSLATGLAAEMAAGRTLLCAHRYATTARQIVVLDPDGGGASSAAAARRWPHPQTQHQLCVARDADVLALFPAEQPDAARRDATLVSIRLDLAGLGPLPDSMALGRCIAPIEAALQHVPAPAIQASPGQWEVVLDTAAAAAKLATLILRATANADTILPAIGVARGIVTVLADPATGTLVSYGPAVEQARMLARHATPGVALASEACAVGLVIEAPAIWPCEFFMDIGEDRSEAVYLLTPPQ